MENLHCQIDANIDSHLNDVVGRRIEAGVKDLRTKGQLVAACLEKLLAAPEGVDFERARRTTNRVSRYFSINKAIKKRLRRNVASAKKISHSSHYSGFGGWVELALERHLPEYDPKSSRFRSGDDDDLEE